MTDRVVRVLLTGEARQLLATVSQTGAAFQSLGGQGQAAGAKVSQGLDQVERGADRAGQQVQKLQRFIAGAFGAFSAAAMIRELTQTTDEYTALTSRVGLYEDTQVDVGRTLDRVFKIAQDMRAPLIETGNLYVSLKGAGDELGATQEDLFRFVTGVNAALAINKTTTSAAAGGLLQLSQMMGGPIVQAQEFNSLIDAMRPLLVEVAKNLDGAGGTVGKLKLMVNEGKVATKDFFEAAVKGSEHLAAQAQGMQSTIGQALTNVNSSWTRYVGKADQAQGSSRRVADTLNLVAHNFDDVADTALDVGAVLVAVLAGRVVGAALAATGANLQQAAAIVEARREAVLQAQAEIAATAATERHTAALLRQAQANVALMGGSGSLTALSAAQQAHAAAQAASAAAATRATAAMGAASLAVTGFRSVLAALGGPVGIAITGLSLLALWFMRSGDEAETAGGKIDRSLDGAIKRARELREARGELVSDQDKADLESLSQQLVRINSALAGIKGTSDLTDAGGAAVTGLQRQAKEVQAAIASITSRYVAPVAPESTASTPAVDTTAAAEATLARVRALSQAQNAVQTQLDAQRQVALDAALKQQLISQEEYYRQLGQMQAAAVEREIGQRRAELQALAGLQAAVAAAPTKTDSDRVDATKKLAEIDTQRLAIQGQINALKAQETTIAAQTAEQIREAADAMDKRLADVRLKLAEASQDAGAIAAQTRARLEREFADILANGSDDNRSLVKAFIDREALEAEFDAVRQLADGALTDLQREWDSLSQSVQAGTMSQAEAQERYRDALAGSNPDLARLLEQLRELAHKLGPDAIRTVDQITGAVRGLGKNTRTPMQQLLASWANTTDQMQQATVAWAQSGVNALTDFVMTGKASFGDLARSIIADLIRIAIQANITRAVASFGFSSGGAVPGFAAGGAIPGFAAGGPGGPVSGAGTETSDSILARLSNGEYVLRAAAVRSLPRGFLDALNAGGVRALERMLATARSPGYASGGSVGDVLDSAPVLDSVSRSHQTQIHVPVSVSIEGSADLDERQAQQLGQRLQTGVRNLVREELQRAVSPRGLLVKKS